METGRIYDSFFFRLQCSDRNTNVLARAQSTKIQSSSNIELFWPRKLILTQNQCLLGVHKKVKGEGKVATP